MGPHPSLTGDTVSHGTTCTRAIRLWRQKGSCREIFVLERSSKHKLATQGIDANALQHLLHGCPVTKHHIQWQTPGQGYT